MILKLIILLFFATTAVMAQDAVTTIKNAVTQQEIETHVRFLASDELMGRETGTTGIDIAAAYISAYFKSNGVKPLPGMDSYYQAVPFYKIKTPENGEIKIGPVNTKVGENFATTYRKATNLTAPGVFLNYGKDEDLANVNLKDKVAILLAGEPGGTPQSGLSAAANQSKIQKLQDAGAKAVIFLWHFSQVPWQNLAHYLNDDSLSPDQPAEAQGLPYFFLAATDSAQQQNIKNGLKGGVSISYSGREVEEVKSYNVLGYIEGADPVTKDNYMLLSAHYDHVGGKISESGEDLIYNGARDNAVGTSAVMMAADFFASNRPKRSVIFALWTAEEKGLLGSKYFVENPPVELNKIFYNLNIDNAGYNDTTKVTVVGLNRTKAENAIRQASQEFGIEAITDPAPEQNLFDRSDNVNFAKRGIPAPTYSLGFTAFNEEIAKYYHKVTDEAESINFSYITKYTRGYVYSALKIVNGQTDTFWVEGDKYEAAGKELYNK